MASRFRGSFIYLKNIFHKNSTLNKICPQKQTLYSFSNSSSSEKSPKKLALYIFGSSFGIYGLYSYLAPDRRGRFSEKSLKERDYVVKNEIPDLKPSREVWYLTIYI